jgi:hypothetical protein
MPHHSATAKQYCPTSSTLAHQFPVDAKHADFFDGNDKR